MAEVLGEGGAKRAERLLESERRGSGGLTRMVQQVWNVQHPEEDDEEGDEEGDEESCYQARSAVADPGEPPPCLFLAAAEETCSDLLDSDVEEDSTCHSSRAASITEGAQDEGGTAPNGNDNRGSWAAVLSNAVRNFSSDSDSDGDALGAEYHEF